jgi:hypothetical protein
VTTNDELEELADRFNDMASELKESYETLELRVAQRTQELTALNSVAAVVSRSLDLSRILPDALAKTIEVMDMDGGAIFRLNQDTNSLVLFAHQGLGEELVNLSRDLSLESSIIIQVVKTRQSAAQLVSEYPPSDLRAPAEGFITGEHSTGCSEKVLGDKRCQPARSGRSDLAVQPVVSKSVGNRWLAICPIGGICQSNGPFARLLMQPAAKSSFWQTLAELFSLVSIVGFARIVQNDQDVSSLTTNSN